MSSSATATAGGWAPAAPEVGRRRWLVLAVVLAAAFMILLDATIVNVAIPSIGRATCGPPTPRCSGWRPATPWPTGWC